MKDFTLDGRLASAFGLVRQGATFADVGTDHAHLPLALLSEGRIERAVCSDINEGPLRSAMENARQAGLSSKIEFVLTSGATALFGKGITDYAIMGMGGELIADIIAAAPHLMTEGVRIIAQPMTRRAALRRTLATLGFEIINEVYSSAAGRYYVTILAEYTGKKTELTDVEAELGFERFLDTGNPLCRAFLENELSSAEKIAKGRKSAALPSDKEEQIINYLKARLSL